MTRYFVKKPIKVEATPWFKNGDHPLDDVYRQFEDTGKIPLEPREGKIVRYFRRPDIRGYERCSICGHIFHNHGFLDTLEGPHSVCPGDWIITGVVGEMYPCKPRIFELTYDEIDE